MRGSVAKRLRRAAEAISVGKPKREYFDYPVPNKHPPRKITMLGDCTRREYRELKAAYKRVRAR